MKIDYGEQFDAFPFPSADATEARLPENVEWHERDSMLRGQATETYCRTLNTNLRAVKSFLAYPNRTLNAFCCDIAPLALAQEECTKEMRSKSGDNTPLLLQRLWMVRTHKPRGVEDNAFSTIVREAVPS